VVGTGGGCDAVDRSGYGGALRFTAAESRTASVCHGVFTHYKREEDAAMESGKLDEELARMRADPHCVLLCNESFASTNEREGSPTARQIVTALLERGVFVTHL
jgi:DNA mismatch repair ATPase MutS